MKLVFKVMFLCPFSLFDSHFNSNGYVWPHAMEQEEAELIVRHCPNFDSEANKKCRGPE